jgi:hypothetical protein
VLALSSEGWLIFPAVLVLYDWLSKQLPICLSTATGETCGGGRCLVDGDAARYAHAIPPELGFGIERVGLCRKGDSQTSVLAAL